MTTPFAGFVFKVAGNGCLAIDAFLVMDVIFAKFIPISFDNAFVAVGAVGAAVDWVVDVANIHIMNAFFLRNFFSI